MMVKRMRKLIIQTIWGVLASIALLASASTFAQKMDYGRWAKHDPNSAAAVTHAPMETILKFISVNNAGREVYAYDRLEGKPLEYVTEYRSFLEQLPFSSLNKDEQLAAWLNLHNVRVIEKIANHIGERTKMKKHRGTPGAPGDWWSEKSLIVEGIPVSLEDIEQNILINHWQDPKVLYGLFYGVKGSGFKGAQGFSGPTVQRQLDTLAKNFVNNRRNVKIKKKKLELSSLYLWNKDSLFENDEALVAHLKTYAKSGLSRALDDVSEVRTKHKFSWSSNAYVAPRVSNSFGGGVGSGGVSGGGYGGGS
jgi:hypothetical protein